MFLFMIKGETNWQDVPVIRISLEFCFPYGKSDFGVIPTLVNLTSSAFGSLGTKVISLTATLFFF